MRRKLGRNLEEAHECVIVWLMRKIPVLVVSSPPSCPGPHPSLHLLIAASPGKLVPADAMPGFIAHEGRALLVLYNNPHPGLPRLIATVDRPDGSGVVVQDSVGRDLHSYVRERGGLPELEAKHLFHQVVDAVAHCHRHRIILRDIKLGKLFFACDKTDPTERRRRHEDDGLGLDQAKANSSATRVIFADLDGAQYVDAASPLLTDQKGSPAYVSPEVLAFQPYDGAAADAWALGVMLYVMLTGIYPFSDPRPAALFQKIQGGAGAVQFPKDFPPGAQSLICRLLQVDPAARPMAKEVLADLWFAPDSPCTGRRRIRAAVSLGSQAPAIVQEKSPSVPEHGKHLSAASDFVVPSIEYSGPGLSPELEKATCKREHVDTWESGSPATARRRVSYSSFAPVVRT